MDHPRQIDIRPGFITIIWGENGSGKTTLLHKLARELAPAYYSGHSLGFIPNLTVKKNMQLIRKLHKGHQDQLGYEKILLEMTSFSDRTFFSDLSQGQKQLVALLSALYSDCAVWFLDEPFAHMDKAHTEQALDVCDRHLGSGGSIVLTQHYKQCDRWKDIIFHQASWSIV